MKERKKGRRLNYTFVTNVYKHETESHNLHTSVDFKLRQNQRFSSFSYRGI